MNMHVKSIFKVVVVATLGISAHSAAYAQAMEIEPNNQCEAAQDLGTITVPYLLSGELTDNGERPSNVESEVDFYKVTVAAGTELVVEQIGAETNSGTLDDPFLGWFNSACELQDVNDDFMSLNSRLLLSPPADGVIIIAASSYFDTEFTGSGSGIGSYELSIDYAPPSIGSISAQAVDAIDGSPLIGNRAPFAFFDLATCNGDDCSMIIFGKEADNSGGVTFVTDGNDQPLPVGTYELTVYADDYEMASSGPFFVGEGANYDAGALMLNPPPISITNIEPCDALPAEGGTCQYRVHVNNNSNRRTGGIIWSLVEAYDLGPEFNSTVFEASTRGTAKRFVARRAFGFDAFDGDTIEFQFTVPASINDGAQFCTRIIVGVHPNPLFNPAQETHLFCVEKNGNGFASLNAQATNLLDNTAAANRRNTWIKP